MDKTKILILLVLMLSACTTYQYRPSNETPTGGVIITPDNFTYENFSETSEELENISEELENLSEELEEISEEIENVTEETETEVEPEETEEEPVVESQADIVAFEGDLIDLKPMVYDPDGDPITLGFTSPFNENGKWQTQEGDAGFYSVIITATDGKSSFVAKQVTVEVLVKNEPPVFGISDRLVFEEGDLIELDPQISDADGDDVVVTYSGWMNSGTRQTGFDDAGTYEVTITADDGKTRVRKTVTVVVEDVNRPPVIDILNGPRIEAVEGDLIELEVEAEDPDGDDVEVEFSEPFNEEGVWQTEEGDEGEYVAEVSAFDGINRVIEEILIEVMKRNAPPVIESITISPSFVELRKPGDEVTVSVDVVASDPDGDDLTITYSGYMTEDTKVIRYGDVGGVKTVTVTVSDGTDTVSQEATFEINNWPCFDCQ